MKLDIYKIINQNEKLKRIIGIIMAALLLISMVLLAKEMSDVRTASDSVQNKSKKR